MERFEVLKSQAVPWLMANVDTDCITPMKRLLLDMDNIAYYSFEPYRFVNGDGDKGALNMDFPLNMERNKDAKIMITGENFGCGSSRETAPEAIRKCGIRCLIGSSFGGIFTKNCYQQGILPVKLPESIVVKIAEEAETGGIFEVDLPKETVKTPSGETYQFEIDKARKQALLEGMNDVERTMQYKEKIVQYIEQDMQKRKWLYAKTGIDENKGGAKC